MAAVSRDYGSNSESYLANIYAVYIDFVRVTVLMDGVKCVRSPTEKWYV